MAYYQNIENIIIRVDDKPTPGNIANYNGFARPGEIVVDPTVSPPVLYIGDMTGNLRLDWGGGGGGGGGNAATANYANFAGTAASANSVAGANVVGPVANAAFATFAGVANSVALANVVGAGNIASINLDGNISNVLRGDGTWGSASGGNANYANFAGDVVNAAQPNITSVGTLTGLTVNGVTNLGPNGNVRISGGTNGQILSTDGTGSLSWINPANATALINGTSNVVVAPSGSVSTSVAGVADAFVVTTAGTETSGVANVQGDIVGFSNVIAKDSVLSDTIRGRTGGITIASAGVNEDVTLSPSGTGNVTLSPQTNITNLKDPVNAQDAATKYYVDALASGLKPKAAVDIATTGPIGGTYNNGTAGVGATLTFGTPLGAIDGITPTVGQRILLKDQADPTTNGIYEVTSSTVLTRATDYDDAIEMTSGVFVFCAGGTVNDSIGFVQISPDVTTVGTDTISFTQQSAPISYSAGTGLSQAVTVFSIADTGVVAGTYGNANAVSQVVLNAQGQVTSAVNVAIDFANAVVNTANFANFAGNVTVAAQPNITSVGTLTGLTVNGVSNLGPNGNVKITGGTSGQFLQTDGTGNLSWANAGAAATQAAMQWVAASNGAGQTFSNVGLANIGSPELASVFVNGVLTPANTYSISGSTLTMSRALLANDIVTVGAFGYTSTVVSGAGGINTQVQYNNAGNLGGITGVTANATAMTFAGVGNISIAGGSNGQVLTTNGSGVLSWGNAGNATAIVNGNSNVVVAANGNVTFGVGGNANMLVVSSNAISMGNVGNVKITGGANGQVLTTDGNGNLTWTAGLGTTSYVNVRRTGTSQLITAAPTTILWNSTPDGTIPYNSATGEFTLTAGVTYELTSGIQLELATGSSFFEYQWYNVTGAAYIGSKGAVESLNSGTAYSGGQPAQAVITPTVTTVVTVRVSGKAPTNALVRFDYSYAEINQIGASVGLISTAPSYFYGSWSTTFNAPAFGQNWKPTVTQLSGIPYDSTNGYWTLTAGKTYRLEAQLSSSTGGTDYAVLFYTVSGNAQIGTTTAEVWGGLYPATTGYVTMYQPSVDTQIKLMTRYQAGPTAVMTPTFSHVAITEISSSVGLPPGPTVTTTPITITGTTTNPTKPTTMGLDYISVEDDKSGWCDVSMNYAAAAPGTGGIAGSGTYLFSLPAGYQFDTAVHPLNTQLTTMAGTYELRCMIPGSSGSVAWTTSTSRLVVVPHSATQFKLMDWGVVSGTGTTVYSFISSGYYGLNVTNSLQCGFRFKKA